MDNCRGLTKKRLEELFHYHEKGYLIWKNRKLSDFKDAGTHKRCNASFENKRAGTIGSHGYRVIGITSSDGYLNLREHRLIYLLQKGYLPKEIDHINGQRDDNRIENLREATKTQNKANGCLFKNNKSGYKGVYKKETKYSTKWTAGITYKSKHYWLGIFLCKEEAARAYNKAAVKYFGEFARLNKIT